MDGRHPPRFAFPVSQIPIIARLHGHFYNGNLSSQVLEYYSEGGLELIEDLLNHPLTLEIP